MNTVTINKGVSSRTGKDYTFLEISLFDGKFTKRVFLDTTELQLVSLLEEINGKELHK